MHTPMRPGTGASEPERHATPVEEFRPDDQVPANYTESYDPRSEQAPQRRTGRVEAGPRPRPVRLLPPE